MPHRDTIVIGASAGGVDALIRLAPLLPADLAAAVFVVVHLSPHSNSHLAERLSAAGPLPAMAAADGDLIKPSRIYVGVPDRHLMIEGNRVRLTRGPRESHTRPSIDVLFRSAAFHRGPRTIGVVLTGMLDDGTAGLWAIKDRGGIAITQSPQEAAYASMPETAARHVAVDYVVTLERLPAILQKLTTQEISVEGAMPDRKLDIEDQIAREGNGGRDVRSLGPPSFYTCPECHGSMIAIEEGSIKRFRCHTGHGFTAAALAERGLDEIEKTLYSALAQLEEHKSVLRELEQAARRAADHQAAERHAAEARETSRTAQRLRELTMAPPFSSQESSS